MTVKDGVGVGDGVAVDAANAVSRALIVAATATWIVSTMGSAAGVGVASPQALSRKINNKPITTRRL